MKTVSITDDIIHVARRDFSALQIQQFSMLRLFFNPLRTLNISVCSQSEKKS